MTFQRIETRGLIRGGGFAGVRETPAGTTTEERPPLFIETLAPQYMVQISRVAVREMQREARRMWLACRDGMHETGGWLLADRRSPDRILQATEPGADAWHTRTGMSLGSERLEQLQAMAPHWVASGSWHLHPGDDGRPSEADRRAWVRWRDLEGVGYHTGLILTGGESSGWMDSQIRAWLTTESFCEPLAWTEF